MRVTRMVVAVVAAVAMALAVVGTASAADPGMTHNSIVPGMTHN
jgi:hypothetical protein